MNKYVMKRKGILFSILLGLSMSSLYASNDDNTGVLRVLRTYLLHTLIERKNVEVVSKDTPAIELARQAKAQVDQHIHIQNKELEVEIEENIETTVAPVAMAVQQDAKIAEPKQPEIVVVPVTAPAAKPVVAPQPAPVPQPDHNTIISEALVELDWYLDHVYDCVTRFLDPNVTAKLPAFAQEIDVCVQRLDANVLHKLNTIKSNPVAAKLHDLILVLKHNQCDFRTVLRGKHSQMGLSTKLLGIKGKASKAVDAALKKTLPTMKQSKFNQQFAVLAGKINTLTNYNPGMMQSFSALGKRI